MLALIRNLMAMASTAGVSLPKLVEIVKALASVGAPPAVTEEAELRVWILKLCDTGGDIADLTPTELDDQSVDFIMKMVNSSVAWGIGYRLLKLMLNQIAPKEPTGEVYSGSNIGAEQEMVAVELQAAMNSQDDKMKAILPISAILAIVSTLAQIIKLFR
jgi:hypothetical protein